MALANTRNYLFSVLIFVNLCFSVNAQDLSFISSEQILLAEVKRIESDIETPRSETIAYLEKLILKAHENQWKNAKLYISVTVLKLYLENENIQKLRPRLAELRTLAEELDDKTSLVELDLIELFLLPYEGKNEQVFALHESLLETATTLEDNRLLAHIYHRVGESQVLVGKLNNAVENFQKAYQKFDMLGDKGGVSAVLNALGNVNSELGNIESSIDFYQQALEIDRSLGDIFSQSIVEYNLHFLHVMKEDYDQARIALENSIILSTKIDDTLGIAFSQQRLADIYVLEQNWQKAIHLLEQTYLIFSENGNLPMVLEGLTNLAIAYIQVNDIPNLRVTLDRFESNLTDSVDTVHQINYQQAKAHWHYLTGDHRSAYLVLLNTKSLEENANLQVQQEELEKLRVQFEVQLKDKENEKLQSLNQVNQQTIAQQKQQQIIWIIVAVLSCLILALLAFLLKIQIRNKIRFRQMAFVDQLTDAPNRRSIMYYAIQSLDDYANTQQQVMIAILDLDKFKRINDTFGHDAGDNVLKVFAKLLKQSIHTPNRFGRFGGEEWLIVFIGNHTELPQNIFNELRAKLKSTQINGIPDSSALSFSMGVAIHPHSSDTTIDETIQLADQYLYQAKTNGRDRICGDARIIQS